MTFLAWPVSEFLIWKRAISAVKLSRLVTSTNQHPREESWSNPKGKLLSDKNQTEGFRLSNSYPGKQDAMEGGKPENYNFIVTLLPQPGKPDTYEDIRGILLTFGINARLESASAALLLLGRYKHTPETSPLSDINKEAPWGKESQPPLSPSQGFPSIQDLERHYYYNMTFQVSSFTII